MSIINPVNQGLTAVSQIRSGLAVAPINSIKEHSQPTTASQNTQSHTLKKKPGPPQIQGLQPLGLGVTYEHNSNPSPASADIKNGPRPGASLARMSIGWRHLNLKRLRSVYRSLQDSSDESSLDENAAALISSLSRHLSVGGEGFPEQAFDGQHSDPALQYILVREALEQVSLSSCELPVDEKKSVEALLYNKAKHMFERQSLPVLSGLNTAEAIAQVVSDSPGLIQKSSLRSLYRSQLIDAPGPAAFLVELLKTYTPFEVLKLLSGIMSAASDDLNSPVSSSPLKLAHSLENLRIGKLIHQVFSDFEEGLTRLVRRYSFEVIKVPLGLESYLMPKDFKVDDSQYSIVFKRHWQEIAIDFIKMLGNVPTRSQLEDKLSRQHLHTQISTKLNDYLKVSYAQFLKSMFERMPEEAYLRSAQGAASSFPGSKIPQHRLDRLTWIDFSADLYKGREVDSKRYLRC